MNNITYHDHLGIYGLILKENKILLIKKARGPYQGLFDLPGGKCEVNELIEETLIREIKEEVGCDIKNFTFFSAHSPLYPYTRENQNFCLKHIDIIYQVEIVGDLKSEGGGEDSPGCKWIDLNNIDVGKITPMVQYGLKIKKLI